LVGTLLSNLYDVTAQWPSVRVREGSAVERSRLCRYKSGC